MRGTLVALLVLAGGLALGRVVTPYLTRSAPNRPDRQVNSLPDHNPGTTPDLSSSSPESSPPTAIPEKPASAPSDARTSTTDKGTATKGTGTAEASLAWAYERFRKLDRNGDGLLSEQEMTPNLRLEREKWDTNRDGQ